MATLKTFNLNQFPCPDCGRGMTVTLNLKDPDGLLGARSGTPVGDHIHFDIAAAFQCNQNHRWFIDEVTMERMG